MRFCRARSVLLVALVRRCWPSRRPRSRASGTRRSRRWRPRSCARICHEPLNMSDSAVAKRIEAYIAVRIKAGDTKSEIKRKLVAQFGPGILRRTRPTARLDAAARRRRRSRSCVLGLRGVAAGGGAGDPPVGAARPGAGRARRRGARPLRRVTRCPKFFAEGLASVMAPCVLPLIPTYLAVIAAVDGERLGERQATRRVLAATLPFLAGLASVFVALGLGVGALTASGIADRRTVDEVAGILLVVLGLTFMGLLPLAGAARRRGPPRAGAGQRVARAARRRVRGLRGALRRAAPRRGAHRRRPRAQHGGRAGLDLSSTPRGSASLSSRPRSSSCPTMGTMRWVRDHYRVLQASSGAALVAFGLLLFFHRDWWLRAWFDDALQALGLTD